MISHESKFMITKFMTNIFTIITRSAAPICSGYYLFKEVSFKTLFFQACQRLLLGLAGHLIKDFKILPYLGNFIFPFCHLWFPLVFSPLDSRLFLPTVYLVLHSHFKMAQDKASLTGVLSSSSLDCSAYCSCCYYFLSSNSSLIICQSECRNFLSLPHSPLNWLFFCLTLVERNFL